jgi:predicted RNase H-like HicB family nuclease
VFIPHFPNCVTEGDTVEEALKNATEALEAILEDSDALDIDALQYSHSPVVVVGEIEVRVPH